MMWWFKAELPSLTEVFQHNVCIKSRVLARLAIAGALGVSTTAFENQLHAQGVRVWRADSIIGFGDGQTDSSAVRFGRITAGVILESGVLAIAHGARIDMIDVNDGHVTSIGGFGGEAGLFRSIDWLGTDSTSQIIAYDSRSRQVAYFDEAGTYIRAFTLDASEFGVAPWIVGNLADGRLVAAWRGPPITPSQGGIAERRVRLVLYDSGGRPIRQISEVPGGEAFLLHVPGRGFALRRAPFSPVPRYVAHDDMIYVAGGRDYATEMMDLTGQVRGVIGDTADHVAVTDSLKEAFLRDTLSTWPPGARQRVEAALRDMLVHESFPLLADMTADGEGNVWLRRRQVGSLSHAWNVYDRSGQPLAAVDFPPHLSVLDIRDRRVLLLHRDAAGRDRVTLYSIYAQDGTAK